ncbi:MAG TPA: prepilin-type N-terminal cleavage/methylation domain-containing protein [Candidatus Eremiobacteraceae bacterium]|nr:prepilin-type N-terminal cleavage/methylation domain-containing protein [Candidatus Eremiobacteraceae bacterium]
MRAGRHAHGMTLIEVLIAAAILALASALVLLTPFRAYVHGRAASDAATTMAQDIALLERAAQNGGANDGATLQIVSTNPLVYDCYYGRPNALDPNSALGPLIVHRSFDDVALTAGPIGATTPLLFASNGSEQYVAAGIWADQHQTIELTLTPASDASRAARVDLNLFTGGVSVP